MNPGCLNISLTCSALLPKRFGFESLARTAAPAGGGFVFGGQAVASTAGGNGGGGGGFTFGGPPAVAAGNGFVFQGTAAAPSAADNKRRADDGGGERRTEAKRRRTRELRLTGQESGTVHVTGNGDCGQLGLGDEDEDVRDSLTPCPLAVLDGKRVCQVVCGGLHTVVLTLDGRLWSWGCNDDEVLGRDGNESVPLVVEGALVGKRVTKVTAGDNHTAALTSEGQVPTCHHEQGT